MKKSPTDYDIPARVSLAEIRSTTNDMAADRKVIVGEIKFLVGILKAHHKALTNGAAQAQRDLAQVDSYLDVSKMMHKAKVEDVIVYDEYILEDE